MQAHSHLARALATVVAAIAITSLPDRAFAHPLPGEILLASGWNSIDCQAECAARLKPLHWLALVPGKTGWSLVPTTLALPGENEVGLRSRVAGAEYYLSHPSLVAGHAATPDVRFASHGSVYDLAIEANAVVLRSGDRMSKFGGVNDDTVNPDETTLLWAGDLDGDGKLDLIYEWSDSKTAQVCLMLSSAAKQPGQLVADVACQGFSG